MGAREKWLCISYTPTVPQYIWGPLMTKARHKCLAERIAFMLMKDDQSLAEKRSRTL